MRKIIVLFCILLTNCSFDNKTGIWQNSNITISKNEDKFKDFKTLYSKQKLFDSLIIPPSNLKISIDKPVVNLIL